MRTLRLRLKAPLSARSKRRTMSKNNSVIKDANGQLQEWVRKGVKADEQIRQVEGWLKAAKPFIVHWADDIGQIENLTEKTEALNDFFKNGVVALSAEDRAGFKDALCEALNIRSTQWTDRLKALKGIVSLPTELGEEMSEDELLAITRLQINRYFDFGGDDFFSEVSPLYVPFTYIYDGFMEVSYFRALGDYGTGKTRFLKTIGKICYRPIYMSGGSSAASIYHLLDLYRGTLVLNEGDFTNSDEASIIAKILKGGTKKGERITKMRGTREKMDESQIDRSLEPRLNQITLSLMATIKDEKTKAKIQEFLKKYNETERGDRYSMFSARVLEGVGE